MSDGVRFLVDTQLPAALARWLRDKGHQAEDVLDVNLAQSKDTPIWRSAQEHGAVIVTKDEDFAEWVRRVVLALRLCGCVSATRPPVICWFGWSHCCR